MQQPLPKLVITRQSNPRLFYFLRHHPEIFEVFHNIETDRPLDTGVLLASGDTKEIVRVYIENLHIPILLEHEAIRENPSTCCGYEPLISGMEYKDHDSVSMAHVAGDRAVALSRVAKPTDSRANSLYCYYHGVGESVALSERLLDNLRALIMSHATHPGEAESHAQGMSFDVIISARISNHDKE